MLRCFSLPTLPSLQWKKYKEVASYKRLSVCNKLAPHGIPWCKGKTGRFCPYCGRSIREYSKQDKLRVVEFFLFVLCCLCLCKFVLSSFFVRFNYNIHFQTSVRSNRTRSRHAPTTRRLSPWMTTLRFLKAWTWTNYWRMLRKRKEMQITQDKEQMPTILDCPLLMKTMTCDSPQQQVAVLSLSLNVFC